MNKKIADAVKHLDKAIESSYVYDFPSEYLLFMRTIFSNLSKNEKIRDIIEDNVYEKDGDVMGQTEAAQAIIAYITTI